jgi:hypothetical protein
MENVLSIHNIEISPSAVTRFISTTMNFGFLHRLFDFYLNNRVND